MESISRSSFGLIRNREDKNHYRHYGLGEIPDPGYLTIAKDNLLSAGIPDEIWQEIHDKVFRALFRRLKHLELDRETILSQLTIDYRGDNRTSIFINFHGMPVASLAMTEEHVSCTVFDLDYTLQAVLKKNPKPAETVFEWKIFKIKEPRLLTYSTHMLTAQSKEKKLE